MIESLYREGWLVRRGDWPLVAYFGSIVLVTLATLAIGGLWECIQRRNQLIEMIRKVPVRTRLAVLGTVAFGYFVWPTPYEYTVWHGREMRRNRFTGAVQTHSPYAGWIP